MISKLTFYLKLGFKFPKFSDVFPPVQTDPIPFPLVHISHQDLLNKMLKDHDVDVLSAISCFIFRYFTCIRDYFRQKFSLIFTWPTQTLFWVVLETCELFLMGDLWKLGEYTQEIRNNQSTISRNQILRFLWRIGNQKQVQTVADRFADLLPSCAFLMRKTSWIED